MAANKAFLFSVTTLLLVATYWASITNLEILTNAPGKVIPIGNVREIQNLEGGIIREVFVVEGQKINGGEKLIELEAVSSESQVGEIEAYLAFLEVESTLISSVLHSKEVDFSDEISTNYPELITNGKAQLDAKLKLLTSEVRLFENRIASKKEQIQTLKDLLGKKQQALSVLNEKAVLLSKDSKRINDQKLQEQRDLLAVLEKQVQLTDGDVVEIRAQKLKEEETLLVYLEKQIEITQSTVAKDITLKIQEKEKTLKLLEEQIEISEDLLEKQITSQLAHLDLLRDKQRIKSEIQELNSLENQRELEKLDLLRAKQSSKARIQDALEAQKQRELSKLGLDKSIQSVRAEIQQILAEGNNLEIKVLDLKRQKQELQNEISKVQQQISDLKNEILEANIEVTVRQNQFQNDLATKLQQYTDEKNKYRQRLQRFEDELGRRIITSPVDGTVKKIHVFTIGGVAKPGMNLIEVVPAKEELIVEAQLPTSDVGYVQTGQEVLIRLSGPNATDFDAIVGQVVSVSPDTLQNQAGEEFYQVKVYLNTDEFMGSNESYKLRAGLSVDCAFVISNRSVLANILAPLISAQSKAFSENVWNDQKMQLTWLQTFRDMLLVPVSLD